MKYLISLGLFVLTLKLQAQQVAVVILEENSKTHYTFKGYNTLEDPVEITFELKDVSGLEYDQVPIVLLIPPKDTLQIAKFKKTGGGIGFLMDYQQILIPAEPEKLYKPEDFKKYETGIVVFSKDGCARCNYTTQYLIEKKVNFSLLNISQNPGYNQYMWDRLKAQGILTKQPRTPIIMVDGVMSHSHEDLRKFVKDLTKNRK
jgi:glutaredoxin